MKNTNSKSISAKIPVRLLDLVKARAERNMCSSSDIVRQAIIQFFGEVGQTDSDLSGATVGGLK
jgi:hypothetical protein